LREITTRLMLFFDGRFAALGAPGIGRIEAT
jgi:hypothetical protein